MNHPIVNITKISRASIHKIKIKKIITNSTVCVCRASNSEKRKQTSKFTMKYYYLTESRAALKSSVALRFSGLSGNTYSFNMIFDFHSIPLGLKYNSKDTRKQVSSYNASSCFHFLLQFLYKSQGQLNIGITELI